MRDKDSPKNAPQPHGSQLVKATVRAGNSYGNAAAGDVVEVTPEELMLCAHALIGPAEFKQLAEAKVRDESDEQERLRVLDERRAQLIHQRDAAKQGRDMVQRRRAERVLSEPGAE